MTLEPGTQIGPYVIGAPIGAGGMGEVLRARDGKLGRDVAIKVLPKAFTEDPDRVARFRREAQILASLNHPNIAAIYGLEERDGTVALALELVEGEDVAQRLTRGAIPLDEAIAIARQIAEALEEAHEKGIVHRDLKPANVKLTPDGKVKVLDFGLAKAYEGDTATAVSGGLSQSPTMSRHMTEAGMILGTAAYMSPEQARGRRVDRRADIWGFGVVFFEMLSGRRLFEGETVSDVLAAVLRSDPDWTQLPSATPYGVKRLLGRCLERDPRQRLRDIGDARLLIDDVLAGRDHAPPGSPSAAPVPGRGRPWRTLAAGAALASVAFAAGVLAWRARTPEERVFRATIRPPEGETFYVDTTQPGPPVLSPDGRRLAFTGHGADGKVRLFVRSLDSSEAQSLAGTEGAQYPFWSPDGRFLAFGADQKLKRIEASGGPPSVLCAISDFPKGGAWSPKGVIVFAPGAGAPLRIVSENGGEAKPLTKFDAKRGDNSHRLPFFLPDGRHFLFLARISSALPAEGHQVLVGSIDGGEPRALLRSPAAAEYASGYLLFLRERALMAQRFDPERLALEGEAHPVLENVSMIVGAAKALFSSSQAGVLVGEVGPAVVLGAELEWADRGGKKLGTLVDRAAYDEVSVSPDGRSVAVAAIDEKAGTHDIWVCDAARNLKTRFTFEPGEEVAPRWTPDGRSVVYVGIRGTQQGLYRKQVGGSGVEELLYASENVKRPTGVSPDGRLLAFNQLEDATLIDIWILPLTGDRKPTPFLRTNFIEANAVFSPDGKWLAYNSNESGKVEVYVTPFPGPGRKWQVSAQGGRFPAWRKGGREILYQDVQGNRIVSVPVAFVGDAPEFGKAEELFAAPPPLAGVGARFDSTADGTRFILSRPDRTNETGSLTLVVNWPAELRGKR